MSGNSQALDQTLQWGQLRYNDRTHLNRSDFLSDVASAWTAHIELLVPDAKLRVERAVKAWNHQLRDLLRGEMGFRMVYKEQSAKVPISVIDGLPHAVREPLAKVSEGWAALMLRQPVFQRTFEGVQMTSALLDVIAGVMGRATSVEDERSAFKSVSMLLEELNRLLDAHKLPEQILKINEDVLGAYYFRIPSIAIFWVPIALVSQSAAISLEGLTVVVLAHELAHAYTHIGHDIDGATWETDDFAQSPRDLVEGLAQYYTEVLCKSIAGKFPQAIDAFEAIYKKQSEIYTAYRDWDEYESGEAMRQKLRYVSNRDYGYPVGPDGERA